MRMTRFELVPERRADGTIVLRPVELGPLERLRRLVRRLMQRA
jgi:hypothetical protein